MTPSGTQNSVQRSSWSLLQIPCLAFITDNLGGLRRKSDCIVQSLQISCFILCGSLPRPVQKPSLSLSSM